MIKNVIFNMVNVLTHFGWREFIGELGLNNDTISKFYEETILSDEWMDYKDRKISQDELREKIRKCNPQYEKAAMCIFERRLELNHQARRGMNWVSALKEQGYKIYVFTNYQMTVLQKYLEADILVLADGKVMGEHKNIVNLTRESYSYILNTYRLKPEECVYVDDNEENIKKASLNGITGILFEEYDEALQRIEALNK